MVTKQAYIDFLQQSIANLETLPCDGMFLIQLVPMENTTAIALGGCNVSAHDHRLAIEGLVRQLARENRPLALGLLAELSVCIGGGVH